MSTILSTLQEVIRHELRGLRVAELGLVEAVYPHREAGDSENYGCDVRLKNSGLLLKQVPAATGQIGTAAIPNIGDLVLLTFDRGDINQPIIIGRLYNDIDRPPANQPNQIVFRLPLAGADSQTIKADIRNFPDQKPPRQILIELPPSITINITDDSVQATAGKTEVKLDGGRRQVTITAGRSKITLDQDGDVTVEAAGAMTLKANGDLTLEGRNLNLKSRQKTEIAAGTQADLKAKLGATINGGLSATLQGTNTSIKGNTSFSP